MLRNRLVRWAGVFLLLFLASCTTVEVQPVDTTAHVIKKVTVLVNNDVAVKDFISVLEKRILFHGMTCYVSRDNDDKGKGYVLTYTARRSWDHILFLNYAELNLSYNGELIAHAVYKMPNAIHVNKFDSTETKMNPVIDELFGYLKQ